MHEYSITSSIIDILKEIGRKNGLKKIKKVYFELNPISSIEPESIRFYYQYLTGGDKLLKDAELLFSEPEFNMRCMDCGKTFTSKEYRLLCPRCGGTSVMAGEIEDIKIVSVEA